MELEVDAAAYSPINEDVAKVGQNPVLFKEGMKNVNSHFSKPGSFYNQAWAGKPQFHITYRCPKRKHKAAVTGELKAFNVELNHSTLGVYCL